MELVTLATDSNDVFDCFENSFFISSSFLVVVGVAFLGVGVALTGDGWFVLTRLLETWVGPIG